MPQPGQKSVTLPDEAVTMAEDYFKRNEKTLKAERIRSVSALIQEAIITYIKDREKNDEVERGRKSLDDLRDYFDRHPEALPKGFDDVNQLIEAALKERKRQKAVKK